MLKRNIVIGGIFVVLVAVATLLAFNSRSPVNQTSNEQTQAAMPSQGGRNPASVSGFQDSVKVNAVTNESVTEALNKAEDLASNRARSFVLEESAVVFRQNGLPWRILISFDGNLDGAIPLGSLNFVFDTRTFKSDKRSTLDLFRDSLSLSSSRTKSGAIITNVMSRKENWFNSDAPIAIAGSDGTFASATVYENLWQSAPGSAIISGTLLGAQGFRVVCDPVSQLCLPDGIKLTTADMIAVWAQVNNQQTGIGLSFTVPNLKAEEADDLVTRTEKATRLTFFVVNENNEAIIQVSPVTPRLNFRPERTNPAGFWLQRDKHSDGSNLYTLFLPMSATKANLPCVYRSFCK